MECVSGKFDTSPQRPFAHTDHAGVDETTLPVGGKESFFIWLACMGEFHFFGFWFVCFFLEKIFRESFKSFNLISCSVSQTEKCLPVCRIPHTHETTYLCELEG